MANSGFMAFQKLKKHVSVSLNIPNSVQAAKIAGIALKNTKETNPEIDTIMAIQKTIKEFNIDKYKKN
jgi:hypothetical protein